jgi:ABC-type polysaccharide/polyol phosphate export permease
VNGICLVLGTFCVVLRNSIFVGNTAMIFFLTLSGGYIPRDDLPAALQPLAEVIPMAHGFVALRRAFDGATIGAVWEQLAAEVALAVLYTAIGYSLFRLLERVAVRSGTYDLS